MIIFRKTFKNYKMKKIIETIEKGPWIGGVLMSIAALPTVYMAIIGVAILSLNFIYWKNIQKTKTVLISSAILSFFIFLRVFVSILEEFVFDFGISYIDFPRSGFILIGSIWAFLYSFNEYKKQN